MVELSSYLTLVQVSQTSTKSPVLVQSTTSLGLAFCVHVPVLLGTSSIAQSIRHPLCIRERGGRVGQFTWIPPELEGPLWVPRVKSSGNPAYVLSSINGNSGTLSTHGGRR